MLQTLGVQVVLLTETLSSYIVASSRLKALPMSRRQLQQGAANMGAKDSTHLARELLPFTKLSKLGSLFRVLNIWSRSILKFPERVHDIDQYL